MYEHNWVVRRMMKLSCTPFDLPSIFFPAHLERVVKTLSNCERFRLRWAEFFAPCLLRIKKEYMNTKKRAKPRLKNDDLHLAVVLIVSLYRRIYFEFCALFCHSRVSFWFFSISFSRVGTVVGNMRTECFNNSTNYGKKSGWFPLLRGDTINLFGLKLICPSLFNVQNTRDR